MHSVFREPCCEEENTYGEKNGEFTSGDDFDGDAVCVDAEEEKRRIKKHSCEKFCVRVWRKPGPLM